MKIISVTVADVIILAFVAAVILLLSKLIIMIQNHKVIYEIKKIRFKHIAAAVAIAAILIVLEQMEVLPYAAARTVSFIYVTVNYPAAGLKFTGVEYDHSFGDYSIRYQDKSGNTLGLMLTPKEFPFFVVYDSKKGNC